MDAADIFKHLMARMGFMLVGNAAIQNLRAVREHNLVNIEATASIEITLLGGVLPCWFGSMVIKALRQNKL